MIRWHTEHGREGRDEPRPSVVTGVPHETAPSLHVLVRTFEQLDAALAFRAATVYCEFEDIRRYREAVVRARDADVTIGLATLRIIKPGEEGFLRSVGGFGPDCVLIRNLAALEIFREEFPSIRRIGDFSLNIANELTADLFLSEGLARITPSYDLNWEQFAALVAKCDPLRLETVVHQHMPMFHNEHCVFAAALSNGKDHRDCGRPCDRHRLELRDQHGADFPSWPTQAAATPSIMRCRNRRRSSCRECWRGVAALPRRVRERIGP